MCRVPPVGPLSSIEAYAAHGTDLFGAVEQFSSWLSCRAPRCPFDILVIRYETLNASLSTLFDFLDLPLGVRAMFPYAQLRPAPVRRLHGGARWDRRLVSIYGALEEAISGLPTEGLLLQNSANRTCEL